MSLQQAAADTCLLIRLPNTNKKVLFSLLWGHCSFPQGLGALKILFVPSKRGVCFPQSWVTLVVKSYQPIKSDLLGTPSPFVEFPGQETDVGLRTFTTVGELFWFYCSLDCGSPIQHVWDFFLSWLYPSYYLVTISSLSLDMGYLFFFFLVGSTVLLSMVVQQLAAILVFSQEKMSTLLPLCHLQPATSILSFLRNLYTVLHSGYISLHSH